MALHSAEFLKSRMMAKKPCRLCRQALPATAFKEKQDGTRTLACVKCLAARRPYEQAYQRGYRQTHHEQSAEYKRQDRREHREEHAAYQQQYALHNPERVRARRKAYVHAHKEQSAAPSTLGDIPTQRGSSPPRSV